MSVFDQVAKYKADELQRAEKKLFRARQEADAEYAAVKWLIEHNVPHGYPGATVCPLRGTDVTVVFAAEYLNDAQRIALRKIMRRAPFAWRFNTYAA